jgi:sugar phosphate isomerase/epimerase
MKIGANTVLFGGYDLETAFKYLAMSGYEGVELSTMDDLSQHLVLSRWQQLVPEIQRLSKEYGLELLAMERSATDPIQLELAFQAAVALKIPVVAIGSGGKTGDEESFKQTVDLMGKFAERAGFYGVTLCVKAHVGSSVYNIQTMLRMMEIISHPFLRLNMDPSHIYRAGEDPVEVLNAVLPYVGHIHIRDCKGRQSSPGKPENQVNGRGDVDLLGFFRLLHQAHYSGACDLEVIGAKNYTLEQCCVIAAESRGHMQACLQACGAR